MANIDTDLILASLNRGEDYVIPGIAKKNLAYVRCWANRRGFFVSLRNGSAVVSKENSKRFRTEFIRQVRNGDQFFVKVTPDKIQYIRTLVYTANKETGRKYHAHLTLNRYKKPVVDNEGLVELLILQDHQK